MKTASMLTGLIFFIFLTMGWASQGVDYTHHQDISYLTPDRSEKLDLYIPKKAKGKLPVVLYIHGGGWTQGDKAWGLEKPNCEALAKAGYAVASINYKLNSKKTCDAYPQNIYDCKTAIRFLRKESATYGLDPQRIAVAGGSAGGHLAMLMAYTPEVKELNQGALYPEYSASVSCVINLFGVADVRSWGRASFVDIAKCGPQEAERILVLVSPITHITAKTVPTLVIHGSKDPTVPFTQAEALVKRLADCGVQHKFIPIENGEHAFPIIPHLRNVNTNLVPEVLLFLKQHL